jgi:putative hydrolase of the HAD superfamily
MHRYGNKTYPKSTIIDTAVIFRALTMRRFGVFSGLYDVLGSLAEKYNMALISDAQWVFAEPEIAMLGLDRFLRFRLLSSRIGFKKPDVRLFEMAMKKFMANPGESVYIGDNPQKDLVGAKKAGMKFIIFRSEYKVYNGFQPDQCFHDYAELGNVLDTLWPSKSQLG